MYTYAVCLWCWNINGHSVVTLRCRDEGEWCVFMRGKRDVIQRGLLPHCTHLHCLIDWFYKNWYNYYNYFEKSYGTKWVKRKGRLLEIIMLGPQRERKWNCYWHQRQKVEKILWDAWWLKKKLRWFYIEDAGQLQFMRYCYWWKPLTQQHFWETQFGVGWLTARNDSLVRNSSAQVKAWSPWALTPNTCRIHRGKKYKTP